ncbi:protein ABHD4-like isoform X2 [Dendronephthya gigantea]|uniref:protein ABHD4-like isoform X2 n=1 Tax=Dendronephthya gigantea TaxID=151771 RepID=UPI00106BA01A|nr:protein ABHD4-like isoform X2 [Dendronephthya gigantea]
MEEQEYVETQSRWYSNWFRWRPTSDELLRDAEARILKKLDVPYKARYVTTSQQEKIWTVSFNPEGTKTPILMIHGFGAGLGMWALNIKELSKDRPVHTFDVLGFARSSRPSFDGEAEAVEETFINSIEDTRKELGLEKFILFGHSFGGYLAYAYTIKHQEQVKSLILADPWGFSEKPEDWDSNVSIPIWIKLVVNIMQKFNPFSGIRVAGPLGPSLVRRFRPDLERKFSSLFDDDTILNYIYHCNAQKPSGEVAFKKLVLPYGWAKFPMIHRMKYINAQIKVTMLFGSHSWIDNSMTEQMVKEHPNQFSTYTISGAGHHVYADQPQYFNSVMTGICESFDKQFDLTIEGE